MEPLLEVRRLTKEFPIHKGLFRRQVGKFVAVRSVSFKLMEGEILGLVGESGSGKTTIGRMINRLIEPSSGEILYRGQNILHLNKKELRVFRQKIQVVFQDPYSSLNPRKSAFENIGEALLYHRMVNSKQEQFTIVKEIAAKVGIPSNTLNRYPHQFSGGQQQRLSIGRALAMKPDLLICDEAVSALDLSIQAQILNLLYDLKKTMGLTLFFISHDLNVVKNFCDQVCVLNQGSLVESGPVDTIFSNPQHAYTRTLLSSLA